MHIDLLGAKRGIDQPDLLAAPGLHRAHWAFVEVQNFEHARSLPSKQPPCNIARP
jgi:hypothetical protein